MPDPSLKPTDDIALPAGKSCTDGRSFELCLAFIGERHINAQATRCDWAPSRFVERTTPVATTANTKVQIGPTDI